VPEPKDHNRDRCFECTQSSYISAKTIDMRCGNLQEPAEQSMHPGLL